jgi:hypothetical protein
MKTTFKTLICALALGTTVAFAGPGSDAKKTTTFQTGIYAGKDGQLNVNIEKNGSRYASLSILDARGNVLAREGISRKYSGRSFRFNLKHLPDGDYSLAIATLGEKRTTPFTLRGEKDVTRQSISVR